MGKKAIFCLDRWDRLEYKVLIVWPDHRFCHSNHDSCPHSTLFCKIAMVDVDCSSVFISFSCYVDTYFLHLSDKGLTYFFILLRSLAVFFLPLRPSGAPGGQMKKSCQHRKKKSGQSCVSWAPSWPFSLPLHISICTYMTEFISVL